MLTDTQEVKMISLDMVIENEFIKVRNYYDEESLTELSQSFSEIGAIMQPIVVRLAQDGQRFELIFGSRRLRAMRKSNHLNSIPAIIINADDRNALEIALSENLQRQDLTPFEEACAISKLMKEFGLRTVEIAKRVGKKEQFVSDRIKLLSLPKELQELVAHRKLSLGHVNAIASIKSPEEQSRFAREVIENSLSSKELRTHIQEELGRRSNSGVKTAEIRSNELNSKKVILKIKNMTEFVCRIAITIPKMHEAEKYNVKLVLERLEEEVKSILQKIQEE